MKAVAPPASTELSYNARESAVKQPDYPTLSYLTSDVICAENPSQVPQFQLWEKYLLKDYHPI